MLNRQKIILQLLKEAGGSATRLQLVKWAFLLTKETSSAGGSAFYKFVPYYYGPFSFSLSREMDDLLQDGMLQGQEGNGWKLTEAGAQYKSSLEDSILQGVSFIINRYGKMTVGELIDSIYERYPWFTVNSKNVEKRRQARPCAKPAVYTIGYEGLPLDGFLNALIQHGIQCLVDVRNNPISRRYGFHKSTLSHLCEKLGIEYRHIPELGIPASQRENLHTADDYEHLFIQYRRNTLSKQTLSLKRASELLASKPSALLCMEANPASCHRSHLALELSKYSGLPVQHLAVS